MQVRVRVGAALETTPEQLYRPLVDGAKVAARQISDALSKSGRGSGRSGGGAGAGTAASKEAADEKRAFAQSLSEVLRNMAIKKRARQDEAREIALSARDLAHNLALRKRMLAEEAAAKDKAAQADKRRANEAARDQQRAERAAARRVREREGSRDHVRGIRERYEEEQRRASERSSLTEQSFGRRTSYRAIQHFGGILRAGSTVARDIARGAGVQTDIGSLVGSSIDLQTRATDLSNQAYMPGEKGPNGQRQDPRALIEQAREIGDYASFDPTKVMEGLQAFVAKTGDLQAGRDALRDLAKLSLASGTALEDMVDAAGDVANALGNTEDKGAKTVAIMKSLAGQGKIGAVEMKSLAVQMAKLGSSATAFEGDPSTNIAKMGAFAQMARAKGGAASATQAATSVASLINIFKTPARMNAFFNATGKKVYNTKTGMLRDPEELLLESLRATKGDPGKFKKIFANTGGSRAVEGFATVYRQAGGGKAGEAAVREEFGRYMKIAMGDGEIEESFKRKKETDEANVQLFNNQLSKVGDSVTQHILPQLARLGPTVIDAVTALGQLTAWAADNPWKAVFTALGASIARAAGEATLRSGIESAIKATFTGARGGAPGLGGAGGGQFVAAPGGKGGQILGALGSALAITAAAVTITEVGSLVIDKVFDMKDGAEDNTRNALMAAESARIAAQTGIKTVMPGQARDLSKDTMMGVDPLAQVLGAPDAKSLKDVNTQREILAARISAVKESEDSGSLGNMFPDISNVISGAANYVSGGEYGTSFSRQSQLESDKASLDELKAETAKNTAVLERFLGGTLNVNVVSGAAAGPPQPTGGRVGAEGDYIPSYPGI
jgi:hypothetical protein